MVSVDDLKRTEAKLTQRKQKKESNYGEEKKKSTNIREKSMQSEPAPLKTDNFTLAALTSFLS